MQEWSAEWLPRPRCDEMNGGVIRPSGLKRCESQRARHAQKAWPTYHDYSAGRDVQFSQLSIADREPTEDGAVMRIEHGEDNLPLAATCGPA